MVRSCFEQEEALSASLCVSWVLKKKEETIHWLKDCERLHANTIEEIVIKTETTQATKKYTDVWQWQEVKYWHS